MPSSSAHGTGSLSPRGKRTNHLPTGPTAPCGQPCPKPGTVPGKDQMLPQTGAILLCKGLGEGHHSGVMVRCYGDPITPTQGRACKVLSAREEEETSLLSRGREGDTTGASLGMFRSHPVNKDTKATPGRWNSTCEGTERGTNMALSGICKKMGNLHEMGKRRTQGPIWILRAEIPVGILHNGSQSESTSS